MDTLSPQLIKSALSGFPATADIFIAYSGGVDSHVLLHLTASITALRGNITAIYINHGLQPEARQWAVHCEKTAAGLGVKFRCLSVNAHPQTGESPEEAARNARYAALKSLLKTNDVLMVAQHREDQLETVLLQLFRGSGVRGLSGMPMQMPFGDGFLLRPFLDVPKQAIDEYAKNHHLLWVEDPSNQHCDYDRNYLRNTIIPSLKQRWPGLDKTVARTANHCAQAQTLLENYAGQLGKTVQNTDNTLSVSRLLALDDAEQKLMLRTWLQDLGKKMPSQAVLAQLQTEVLTARADAAPLIATPGYCLRRYQDRLYCLPPDSLSLLTGSWPKGDETFKVNAHQYLLAVPTKQGIPADLWRQAQIEVRARQGGEKIRLPYRQGSHTLKKLYQEANIPPWERELMPLIYLDGQLAAVGEYWLAAEFVRQQADCIQLVRR